MVNANNVCTYIEEATIDLLKKKKLKDITIMEVVKKVVNNSLCKEVNG